MPTFETGDGCRIRYRIEGDAGADRTLVFLNATAQTTRNWTPVARRLSGRFRIVLFDGRCQGESDGGTRPPGIDTHADDLEGLAGHLGIRRAGLVGLSHGARVALAAAARRPAWIDGLVLCGVGVSPPHRVRAVHRSWRRVLAAGGLEALAWAMVPWVFGEAVLAAHRGVLPKIVEGMVRRNDPANLSALLAAQAGDPPVADTAGDPGVPALVVSGREDLLAPPPGPALLAGAMGAGHRELEGAGHSLPAEAPDRFPELVAGFFGGAP